MKRRRRTWQSTAIPTARKVRALTRELSACYLTSSRVARAGMSVGVALPAFLFEKGRAAPLVLGGIVGACSELFGCYFAASR